MSEAETKCPVCDEVLEPGDSACKRCGFKLIGKTQTFMPVGASAQNADAAHTSGTPALEVVKGPYAGEIFTMGEGTYSLGRDPGCDVFLSNMTVSRHHATIDIADGKATISDEGSLNGTWVDGTVVERATLNPGARIQIGTFEMAYRIITG